MKKKLTIILLVMLINILPLSAQISKTISVTKAGTLDSQLTSDELMTTTSLVVTGQIDQRDFVTMSERMPVLAHIDIKNTNIVAYNSYAANEIPNSAFYSPYLGKKALKSIVLPATLTSIGELAFCYCRYIANIDLPVTLTKISNHAFYGCSGLKKIEIPAAVKWIGEYAFNECTFTSINIKATTPPTIQEYALREIRVVYVPKGSGDYYKTAQYWNEKSIIESEGSPQVSKTINVTTPGTLSTLLTAEELSSVTDLFLSGEIDQRDFVTMNENMPVLANIDMKSTAITAYNNYNTNEVPVNAFYTINSSERFGKKSLESVILPTSVTNISNNAFCDCRNLKNVTLPEKLTIINDSAFYKCNISSLTIESQTPPFMQTNSFSDVQVLYIPKGSGESYRTAEYWKDKVIIEGDGTALHLNIYTAGTLSSEIKVAGYAANEINALILEGELNNDDFAVIQSDMPSLISIDLNDTNVTSIPASTFTGKNHLFHLTIPETLTAIADGTFKGCTGLTNITLPATLTSIGNSAFQNCTGLTSIEISETVKTIGNNVFQGCTSLSNVLIPNTVISIGNDAFNSCMGLTSLSLPKAMISIGNNAFYNCIGLKEINFPETLHGIGMSAFEGCSSLSNIDLPEGLNDTGYGSFADCTGLKSINFPSTLTIVSSFSFQNCTSLTSINLPETLKQIGTGSFQKANLASINIPEAVTSLGTSAFSYNPNMTSVTLPADLNSVGNTLFEGCNLSEIKTLCPTPLDLYKFLEHGIYIFSGINKNTCKLIVPKGTLNLYKSAYIWSQFLNIIEYDPTGITSLPCSQTKTYTANGQVYISSDKTINTIELISLSGKILSKQQVVGYSCQMDLNNENIAILKVRYEDGYSETIKVVNNK